MKAVAKIKLTGLMASPNARAIFEILQAGKKEPTVLFVGGCVRNALLEKPVSDIDLATDLSPEIVTSLLKKAGVKVVPTGIAHGTVTAILKKEVFQITTLRRDVETDGRHAKVAYTDDWAEDAARRDFTLNTLLADIKGNIYDPLGTGLKDLKRRKIIFVGDPEARIREDYLRILRFFRFHAYYGSGQPDRKALLACAALSGGIKTLSKERVTEELFKIFASPDTAKTIALMVRFNILKGIVDKDFKEINLNYLKKLDKADSVILNLLGLSGFKISATRRIEKELRLSNKQQKQLHEILFSLKKFKSVSDHDLKLLLYKTGPEIAELTLVSRLVLDEVPVVKAKKHLTALSKMDRPVMPLRGQDLIDQGMKPGPAIKTALDKFERQWIRGGMKAV